MLCLINVSVVRGCFHVELSLKSPARLYFDFTFQRTTSTSQIKILRSLAGLNSRVHILQIMPWAAMQGVKSLLGKVVLSRSTKTRHQHRNPRGRSREGIRFEKDSLLQLTAETRSSPNVPFNRSSFFIVHDHKANDTRAQWRATTFQNGPYISSGIQSSMLPSNA